MHSNAYGSLDILAWAENQYTDQKDGVLEEWIARTEKNLNTILNNIGNVRRIVELELPVSDKIHKKILEKFGPYLHFKFLKEIPDRIFLEREVWSDLINDIDCWHGGLARRILEIQDDLPAGAFEKIVKEHRQDLDWEGLSDSALLRDGVLSTLIDLAYEWCRSIPKRMLEMSKPLPSWAVTKCIKKFGPYLDFDSICKLCLNADSLELEMLELLDLEKIRKEKPDILENLGKLNPDVYSKLKNLSTNE